MPKSSFAHTKNTLEHQPEDDALTELLKGQWIVIIFIQLPKQDDQTVISQTCVCHYNDPVIVTYIHTLLRLPSTGLFSYNVKRKENLFTVI